MKFSVMFLAMFSLVLSSFPVEAFANHASEESFSCGFNECVGPVRRAGRFVGRVAVGTARAVGRTALFAGRVVGRVAVGAARAVARTARFGARVVGRTAVGAARIVGRTAVGAGRLLFGRRF